MPRAGRRPPRPAPSSCARTSTRSTGCCRSGWASIMRLVDEEPDRSARRRLVPLPFLGASLREEMVRLATRAGCDDSRRALVHQPVRQGQCRRRRSVPDDRRSSCAPAGRAGPASPLRRARKAASASWPLPASPLSEGRHECDVRRDRSGRLGRSRASRPRPGLDRLRKRARPGADRRPDARRPDAARGLSAPARQPAPAGGRGQPLDQPRRLHLGPAHEDLRSLFVRHAVAEHRDFRLLEQNYAATGGDLARDPGRRKNVGSEALAAFMYHAASRPDPVGLLGAMFVIEGLGSGSPGPGANASRRQLGLPETAISFLRISRRE